MDLEFERNIRASETGKKQKCQRRKKISKKKLEKSQKMHIFDNEERRKQINLLNICVD